MKWCGENGCAGICVEGREDIYARATLVVDEDGRITPQHWLSLAKSYAREHMLGSARTALALALWRLQENTGRSVAWAPGEKP